MVLTFLVKRDIAKAEDITLCIENMPFRKRHSFSSIEEIKYIVKKIGDSNMKACLDTGHCNVTGETCYDAIKILGNDLACLHVHDDRNKQDRHLTPFSGEVDWNGFTRGLKEIGFKGCISLETAISASTPEPMKEQMEIALSGIAKYFARKSF